MTTWLRSWSPWRLRAALRYQQLVLGEDPTGPLDATWALRLRMHALLALQGHAAPRAEVRRYRVEHGSIIKMVEAQR